MGIHVARQPIFDRRQNVFSYELLYRRSGFQNSFDANTEADEASASVIIDSFQGIGIDTLTGGKKAFINFTGTLLEKEVATLFPKDILVIEVLETVKTDPKIVEKCGALKQAGYTIALDDFVPNKDAMRLWRFADIVKIDFMAMPRDKIRRVVDTLRPQGIRFLAEKVETKEDYDLAYSMGFSYFQGYYFSKPIIVSDQALRPLPVNYFRLIKEANMPEASFRNIADIIEEDVSLSYKLLWMLNTVGSGYVHKIKSVRHALAALGEVEMRKWVSLIAMMGINKDQPQELLYASLIRAHFAELFSIGANERFPRGPMFMTGLFSLMESIMQRPFEIIFKDIPIEQPIQEALQFDRGPFAPVIRLIAAQERGDWDEVARYSAHLGVSMDWVSELYVDSLKWSDSVFSPGLILT